MLDLTISPEMLAADACICAGSWISETDVLPQGYTKIVALLQHHPEITTRLTLPVEVPQINIRVNGVNGFFIFPEAAVTVSLHPSYKTKTSTGGGKAPKPQRKARKDSLYMITCHADKERHDVCYKADTLQAKAAAREHLLSVRIDEDQYEEKMKRAHAEELAASIAASVPHTKKTRVSKNRGVDYRKDAAKVPEAPVASRSEMHGSLEDECNERARAPDSLSRPRQSHDFCSGPNIATLAYLGSMGLWLMVLLRIAALMNMFYPMFRAAAGLERGPAGKCNHACSGAEPTWSLSPQPKLTLKLSPTCGGCNSTCVYLSELSRNSVGTQSELSRNSAGWNSAGGVSWFLMHPGSTAMSPSLHILSRYYRSRSRAPAVVPALLKPFPHRRRLRRSRRDSDTADVSGTTVCISAGLSPHGSGILIMGPQGLRRMSETFRDTYIFIRAAWRTAWREFRIS
ncbi:hypothetical protein FIBSPDRAFT_903270 [Athelia psychrophila]|uniref:Uncharacterized protein n=1 Tax=Athelia psychrophila TaxID=1759441 RepID=A0A167W7H3_9AGAM|nr:hypothetical protein FIBSPDRAFT_903270 [Fibularhizoctonia sp. CBS 109695]